MSLGRSKLMTCFTLEISRPRAATCTHVAKSRERNKQTGSHWVERPILVPNCKHTQQTPTHTHKHTNRCWPLWPPGWGIFPIWTGWAPPRGPSGSGRRGCWCRRSPPDTGSPPRHRRLFWFPRTPKSVSPYLDDGREAHEGLIMTLAGYHGGGWWICKFTQWILNIIFMFPFMWYNKKWGMHLFKARAKIFDKLYWGLNCQQTCLRP